MEKLNTIQVSEFEGILPSLLEYFGCKAQMFRAGSIAAYSHIWQDLTSDPEVLKMMQPKLSDI